MLKLCLRKLGQLAIVMVLISFFSFAIIDLAPGDISSMYLTEDMSEEEKQIVIEKLGLDRSSTFPGHPKQFVVTLVFRFPIKHRWHRC